MGQTDVTVGTSRRQKRRIWMPVAVVLAIAAAVVALLTFGTKMLHKSDIRTAPVMVKTSSHFSMYEERSDTVLLTYTVTLRNGTNKDLSDFALRAELPSDYKSGYLLSPEASVRMWGEEYSTFSLEAGETTSFDLILTARFHKTRRTASGDLPQLYAVFTDGSEARIETVES